MNQGLRIKLEPRLVEQPNGERLVGAGTLTFISRGKEPTHVTGAPQKAELVFSGRLIANARKPAEAVSIELSNLQGELWVEGNGTRVMFKPDPQSIAAWQDNFRQALAARDEPFLIFPNEVALHLPKESFVEIEQLTEGQPLHFALPKQAERYRYLEIGVSLRVGDEIEAGARVNDVLDIELRRVQLADVQIFVFDERGLRMPNTQYRLTTPDDVRAGRTDAEGAINEPGLPECSTFFLEWGENLALESPSQPAFLFARYVDFLPAKERDPAIDIRLRNLGYAPGTEQQALPAFAQEYAKDVNEEGDAKVALIKVHDEGRKLRAS